MAAPAIPSIEFYQAVTDNMREGLYATDAQDRVTFLNRAAEAMLGWTLNEVKGSRIHELIHQQRAFPREARDHDDIFIRKDGSPLPVSCSSSPLLSGDRIVGMVVVFRDAFERRLIEQALKANERDARLLQQLGVELVQQDDPATFYRKLVGGAAEIMQSRFASMQMLHPERGNAGELELLAFHGLPAEEVAGWKWVGRECGTTCGEALRRGVRIVCADTENGPYRAAYHDTPIRAVQSTPLFSRTGAMVGMLSTHWDHPYDPPARDLRNLDILARQAADIIDRQRGIGDADRRKDEFLATLAHELRNPLAPIRNALAVIDRPGIDPDTVAQAKRIMGRQLNQLVRLIDDLMDANRITRGTLELRRQRVELAPIVWEAVESATPFQEIRKKHVQVTLPEQPVFIDADPVRLFQILSNLLNNAHKFTGDDDRISLSAERHNGDLVLTVDDSGVGIPPENLHHVFHMFSQLERTARGNDGLGIGLALVKQLVELHGGAIEVHSEGLGKGSRFVIRLPVISDPPPLFAEKRKRVRDASAQRRVLVVDDNRDGADSLAALLRTLGHQVHVAYDGEHALVIADAERPEVLLLDIGLPKLDGHEVCRRIRARAWAQKALIIAITGWGPDQGPGRSEDSCFDAHLVKPVQFGALSELLARDVIPA